MKYAYYCPACKSFWQSESTSETNVQPCGTCGGAPLFTGYAVERWKALSQAERDAVCARLAEKNKERMAAGASAGNHGYGWIKGLRVFSWLSFAGIIIAGIAAAVAVGGKSGSTGAALLIVAGSVVIAFCAVAVLMVFLGMAEDLRAVRNTLEKKERF